MKIIKSILLKPKYTIISISLTILIFTFSIWITNWGLVLKIISTSSATFLQKILLLLSLFESIKTNFTLLSASYTILISILFGINIALLVYFIEIQKKSISKKDTTFGIGGFVSGLFGIGCSSCGTFLLGSLLGIISIAGIIKFLPLKGEEFGIIGVILISYSIYKITNKIKNQKTILCKI